MFDIVDPSDYRSFCLRGEGRCNFVISAKNEKTGTRIVWRLAKHRKSGTISVKPKCHLVNAYLEKLISPFISESYLVKARIVDIPVGPLHHIAKVPSLPHNLKIENWEELKEHPPHMTVFPPVTGRASKTIRFVSALEMPDATRIPKRMMAMYGPTITVEIKPKQGFFQTHPGVDVPFCNNCILQIEKWKSAAFEQMYDFCPLALYSGERQRMSAALDSLLRDPHRNLRVFMDGDVIHDEESVRTRTELDSLLFSETNANVDTLISTLCCILAGIHDDRDEFFLRENSVLSMLLKAQKIDTIGLVRAFEIYQNLPPNIQQQLMKKSNLLDSDLSFLQRTDDRSLMERYLLAATMKDCSLMISMRLSHPSYALNANGADEEKVVRIGGLSGPLYFAYSIRIVDLDPKSPKNVLNAYERLMDGIRLIQSDPKIHRPCRV
jgi:hypothetical protein